MARDIYGSDTYVATEAGQSSLMEDHAVRMWAPESLEDDEFSSKSDVWSFGMCVGGGRGGRKRFRGMASLTTRLWF